LRSDFLKTFPEWWRWPSFNHQLKPDKLRHKNIPTHL